MPDPVLKLIAVNDQLATIQTKLEELIAVVPKNDMSNFENHEYALCRHCDHFVDANEPYGFIHLEDGEQEFDHAPMPGDVKTGAEWKQCRPDLFIKHPDGAIGPNSMFHSRKGKVDG